MPALRTSAVLWFLIITVAAIMPGEKLMDVNNLINITYPCVAVPVNSTTSSIFLSSDTPVGDQECTLFYWGYAVESVQGGGGGGGESDYISDRPYYLGGTKLVAPSVPNEPAVIVEQPIHITLPAKETFVDRVVEKEIPSQCEEKICSLPEQQPATQKENEHSILGATWWSPTPTKIAFGLVSAIILVISIILIITLFHRPKKSGPANAH